MFEKSGKRSCGVMTSLEFNAFSLFPIALGVLEEESVQQSCARDCMATPRHRVSGIQTRLRSSCLVADDARFICFVVAVALDKDP